MKGQKESVILEVMLHLPTFTKHVDNAILALSAADLESIKNNIQAQIAAGTIEYSKDKTNLAEVRSYARSMVMNHLKKAKELNGGHAFTKSPTTGTTVRHKLKLAPKGVNPDLLPEELKEYVKTLV